MKSLLDAMLGTSTNPGSKRMGLVAFAVFPRWKDKRDQNAPF